jgi:DEAD/DEAH box helicase domain-containing protein
MKVEVIFDVETKNLFQDVNSKNPADLGVSLVSLYRRELDENYKEINGTMYSFWEKDFPNMWKHFQEADRVIGFNSIHFDVPALQPYAFFKLDKLHHLDMLDLVKQSFGKRISLAAIAQETLGHTKIDVGTNAVLYFRKGDPVSLSKLQKYCEADVTITKELYDYGLKNKHVKFKDHWNTQRVVAIDFSYPATTSPQVKQTGLF